ncbi:MAG: methylenetetrahydrofolate reductase [Actinomycetota bacterium]
MARIGDLLARRRTMSFEFFPPSSDTARLSLGKTVGELESLRPDFVSVTYGAAGSSRQRTADVVTWMQRHTELAAMPHLTCRGHRRDEVARLITEYRRHGVENLLALGGDPPADGSATAGDYTHAVDLVEELAATGCFSVGVAAHPEVHPRSSSRVADRRHLADKLRIADFAITQFFFDVDHYRRLVDELADLGVERPIVPGVMPFVNVPALRRMAAMNGTEIPARLRHRLDAIDADQSPERIQRLGVEVATELCHDLLEAGAPGLHLYTLNRSTTAQMICTNLGTTSPSAILDSDVERQHR